MEVTDLANAASLSMLFGYSFVCAGLLKYRVRGKFNFQNGTEDETGSALRAYCVQIYTLICIICVASFTFKANQVVVIILHLVLLVSVGWIY